MYYNIHMVYVNEYILAIFFIKASEYKFICDNVES